MVNIAIEDPGLAEALYDPDADGMAGYEPDKEGRAKCRDCGKRIMVSKDGTLRSHKCETSTESAKKAPAKNATKARKAKSDVAPETTRTFCIAILASGAEWTAAQAVGRAVPCDPQVVPANLPDADAMIGPIVDFGWPVLPAAAQSIITAIADQSDLIAAALAWIDYYRTLRAFTVTAQKNAAIQKQAQQAREGGVPHVTTGQASQEPAGGAFGEQLRLIPFNEQVV